MRETYPLSDETRQVLCNGTSVKEIASEMDVNDSYIYQILSSVECDSFAKFKRLYAACVRAGADVTHWDAALSAIKTRRDAKHSPAQVLAEKIRHSADTEAKMLMVLEDGEIDADEVPMIRKAVSVEREKLDQIEAILDKASTVRDFARKAVNGRK